MATLKEDIIQQSDWVIKAFESDGYKLDYSIYSFIEIDRFFQKNLIDGKPKRGGRLSKNFGAIVFSISSYVAQTLIKNVPNSSIVTDDSDVNGEINFSVELSNGTVCFPAQRVMKRIKNGLEDAIYPYGYELAKEFINESFDQSFWDIGKGEELEEESKPWWKLW
ncbi:hypothetical protein [Flavobacterium sp. UGB4466]|uniref:hypothetical protein n=1 Tax=Flavobacterium sp. UGB4466 TaxID=2730889 RepID=UPI00192B9FDB|nr:hypothetical protein [Flavobacterium sp. UGB4466]